MWLLNSSAYKQLFPFARAAGILFLLLSVALAIAGAGWFKRHVWGWRRAAIIIAAQVLGDLVSMVRGDVVKGGTGFIIAGAVLFYLLRSEVRAAFV